MSTTFLQKVTILAKAINKNKPFCLACGSLARSRIPSSGQGRFILVYRLAMDARPCGVMVGLTENIQACLGDFQTGTASMARKRHLASTARGLLCFCLMTLVTTGLIRSIRIIRGRNKAPSYSLSRKYVQPSLQVRASAPASTCNRPCKHVRLR